jgi:hypothetical protein
VIPINQEICVAMTTLCTQSFDLPTDEIARKRFDIDLKLEIANCTLDGKTKRFGVKKINHNTYIREWRDQQSAEEFYEYFRELFSKYGGTLHYIEIFDKKGD